MAETDIYRMGPTDFDPSDSSGEDDGEDLIDFQDHNTNPPPQSRRPPAIATEWDSSMDKTNDDSTTLLQDISTESRVSFHHQTRQYPTQSLNESRFNNHKTPAPKQNISTPSTEETPAFIRQYARDIMKIADQNLATRVIPPNSLLMVREKENPRHNPINNNQDSSFVGADASGLDSTFVSIRDLNEDDDVPSINNEHTYAKFDGTFPTEKTSLLGNMSWRGGFFPQVEKEDRKERRKMVRDRKGRLAGWAWGVRSFLSDVWDSSDKNGSRVIWDANHPIGAEMPVRSYQSRIRRPIFAMVMTGLLCFHMMLCGLHDLYVRYVSYRNADEVGVSWNGEGTYSPPYWFSFEARVLNPCIGPGPRTLTAFGALVPGLVLSKGHWWRVILATVESSSLLELFLNCIVLRTAVGGSLIGLEAKRGTFAVTMFYFITALVGSAWSMAVNNGCLVTSSGMGVTGLLVALLVEQFWFPLPMKDEDDLSQSIGPSDVGGGHNAFSSNEQFSFEPVQPKKERSVSINVTNPMLLLAIAVLLSWWAPYQSLAGTFAAAGMGLSLALVMFVGKPAEHTIGLDNQDLIFTETPPPPPPASMPGMWRDDDSADSSFGSGRQTFNTPLMRKSILADEDEDEQTGAKSILRNRKSIGSDSNIKSTPGLNGRYISTHQNKNHHTAMGALWRVIGLLMALLLTLIPASLIVAGEDPSYETIRASILGCKPMRTVYKQDDNSDDFQCAGGCVPLSRTRVAQSKEGMHDGRCDAIGFRCDAGGGTIILKQYEFDVGLYNVPLSDGSCESVDDDEAESESAYDNEADNEAQ